MTSDICKYAYSQNRKLIKTLLEWEETYKKIIKSQVEKHNDNFRVKELNNVFSIITVDSKDETLSKYMKKILKGIEFHNDFECAFLEVGVKEFTHNELKQMKCDAKNRPRFNDIKKITAVNVPSINNNATIIQQNLIRNYSFLNRFLEAYEHILSVFELYVYLFKDGFYFYFENVLEIF